VAVFFASWGALHHGFYQRNQIVDTPIYERYGDAMADGYVPYRDFGVEYPPAALPVFVIPSLTADAGDFPGYRRTFESLMAICGALAVALVAFTLAATGASALRVALGAGFAALAPLALGSVVLSRFDLWPALLTVGALAALVSGRDRLGAGVLGVAIAAKVYPAVLLPLGLAWVWRRSGRPRPSSSRSSCRFSRSRPAGSGTASSGRRRGRSSSRASAPGCCSRRTRRSASP
jgi:hypothetical protein